MQHANSRLGGHYPGHKRDAFLAGITEFREWQDGAPEPTVEFETDPAAWAYVPRNISISEACRLVWHCSDVLPGIAVSELGLCGIELRRRTYAAAARELHAQIQLALNG